MTAEFWLTRHDRKRYMLSSKKPIITQVQGTELVDAYIEPGDPGGVPNFCSRAAVLIWGEKVLDMKVMESIKVSVTGIIL